MITKAPSNTTTAICERYSQTPIVIELATHDSLKFAKELRPGQRNSLDALCRAFSVDNSTRSLHGALLDAQLLGEVYIQMTRGQEAFTINFEEDTSKTAFNSVDHADLIVIQPLQEEVEAHNTYLKSINRKDVW
mgnify:CR=1 FL=1